MPYGMFMTPSTGTDLEFRIGLSILFKFLTRHGCESEVEVILLFRVKSVDNKCFGSLQCSITSLETQSVCEALGFGNSNIETTETVPTNVF